MAVLDQEITDQYAIYNGDSCEVLPTIPTATVGLSVYSPPFADLYNYSSSERDLSNCADYSVFLDHYEFIVREDANPRGRERGEIAALIKSTLTGNGVTDDRITIVLNELDAAAAALDRAKPDDLVVLLADKPAEVWELAVSRASGARPAPNVSA